MIARVRARMNVSPCFFTDLLADVEAPAAVIEEALWDLVWAGEATNDAFAPLRAPRLTLRGGGRSVAELAAGRSTGLRAGPSAGRSTAGAPGGGVSRRGRFSPRRRADGAPAHPPGRWSLTAPLFAGSAEEDPAARRRALAELLLERHGILTRELVLAEGVAGGFAALYPELCRLETLGVARRGYFVEGLGGAQFALPGAVERLRAQRPIAHDAKRPPSRKAVSTVVADGAAPAQGHANPGSPAGGEALVLAATDPAQPYGAALPWPRREPRPGAPQTATSPARVPGALVVLVGGEPALYLERGGRALRVLLAGGVEDSRLAVALAALAEHARAGRLAGRIALERVDGEPVLGTRWETALAEVGFRAGPRRLTLSA